MTTSRPATRPIDGVYSFNVPDCTAGTVSELLEVPLAAAIPEGVNPFESDCVVGAGRARRPTT